MNMTSKIIRNGALRALVIASASLAMANGAQAQQHGGVGRYAHGGGLHGGYHGYRSGGPGWVWGGVGLGLGLGLASFYNSSPYYYPEPGYVVTYPPVVYESIQPVQPVYSQPVPARSSQPVIYPRNGQSAATMDADANACSEWAGKQSNATSDPSIFQRGISACMDARGYTVR